MTDIEEEIEKLEKLLDNDEEMCEHCFHNKKGICDRGQGSCPYVSIIRKYVVKQLKRQFKHLQADRKRLEGENNAIKKAIVCTDDECELCDKSDKETGTRCIIHSAIHEKDKEIERLEAQNAKIKKLAKLPKDLEIITLGKKNTRKSRKYPERKECENKKCPTYRPCGCFQNLASICKKAKKYQSCTAPFDKFCSKHQVIHKRLGKKHG